MEEETRIGKRAGDVLMEERPDPAELRSLAEGVRRVAKAHPGDASCGILWALLQFRAEMESRRADMNEVADVRRPSF